MYLTWDAITKFGGVLTALGIIFGVIIAVYKIYETIKRHNAAIEAIQKEQEILCYAMRGALQGLIEQGCNGPCKDALSKMDKHLNEKAHEAE